MSFISAFAIGSLCEISAEYKSPIIKRFFHLWKLSQKGNFINVRIETEVGSDASSNACNASYTLICVCLISLASGDKSIDRLHDCALERIFSISSLVIYVRPTELTKLFNVSDAKSAIAFGKSLSGNTLEYWSILVDIVF